MPIPRAEILGQKYSKLISNVMYAICGGHNHNEPTRPLLEFLSYFDLSKTYQDIWQEAVALNRGTHIPKIGEVTTKAIQSMCNINHNQMRILRNCLQT